MNERCDFVAYSDESGLFDHRYQTISVISGKANFLSDLSGRLSGILTKHDVRELKFEEIRTHRPRIDAALDFVQQAIEFARVRKIRIDVLTWDMHDSRHTVQGRDNRANLARMYYKVLTCIARQWNTTEWSFYPDDNPQVKWEEIIQFLNRTRLAGSTICLPSLFSEEHDKCLLQFKAVNPLNSLQEPVIQLADLFAGLARFIREEGEHCMNWLNSYGNKDQLPLFNILLNEYRVDETTQAKQNRFQIAGTLEVLCKKYKLGISLRDKKCFWTPNPANPINFGNYEPQHEDDKAPRRYN